MSFRIFFVLLLLSSVPACAEFSNKSTEDEVVGTMEVSFQPILSAGVKEGCSLTYSVAGRDHASRQGHLVGVAGNITFATNNYRNSAGLSLKVGTIMLLDKHAKPEYPYFAYLQTHNGTTARSKYLQYDSPDKPGSRIFVYSYDNEVMKVLQDIVTGAEVNIGFNREKGGLDVLIPVDLTVAGPTKYDQTASDPLPRRHSYQMLLDFAECNSEVTKQASNNLKAK